MRIFLTGKTGQVGRHLDRVLRGRGNVVAVSRDEMNLTNADQIRDMIRNIKPDLIVNAAAYTAVDRAESEPDLAMSINGTAPGIMAQEVRALGGALIHYSTDYVYEGHIREEPYQEDDIPNPLNVYGKTKLEGDRAIEKTGVPHLIFRTSWVYDKQGKNFLNTILNLAKERAEIRVVDDQTGTPTWSRAIAEATGKVIEKLCDQNKNHISDAMIHASGIYHMTCSGQTSWHGFARAILDRLEAERRPRLVPIPTSEYPTPASRPAYSVLSNSKLQKTFGIALEDWQTALQRCLKSNN